MSETEEVKSVFGEWLAMQLYVEAFQRTLTVCRRQLEPNQRHSFRSLFQAGWDQDSSHYEFMF